MSADDFLDSNVFVYLFDEAPRVSDGRPRHWSTNA